MNEDDWLEDLFGDEISDLEFEEFDDSEEILLCDYCCPKCEAQNVRMKVWKSEKLNVIEHHFECLSCDYRWWVNASTEIKKYLAE